MSFGMIRKIAKPQREMAGYGLKAAPAFLLALMVAGSPTAAGVLGLDVDVDVSVGNGGIDVGAGVGVGGTGVEVAVGVGGGTGTPGAPGTPGTPGTPGVPGVIDPNNPTVASGQGGASGLACAKDGNETAYNGFVVRDRDGAMIGWVHEATVSKNGKVLAMRIKSTGNSCYKLANAGFRVSGGEIWANVDATAFR